VRIASLLLTTTALAAPEFTPHECPALAAKLGARCGVVDVLENHAKSYGRMISLNVIVLPATGTPQDPKRAQYDLDGGPGFAATDFLEFYAGDGAAYRVTRDIVLADMRGTGAWNPLRCAGIEEFEKRAPWAPMYPPELVAECAAQLSAMNDVRMYSTAAAARDIDLVRRALRYETLDLNAISYGTTLALRYIADFPKAVHAAALMGTVPASRTPPRFHALAAERAFLLVSQDCAADPSCRETFGDMTEHLKAALARPPRDPPVTPDVFLERVRTFLYAPQSARRLPDLLKRAASGDISALTRGARTRTFADGLYLSITCAESFARMDVDAAIASSAETAFGAYRLLRQRDACARWPLARNDKRLMKQPASTVPVLFLGGGRDPVSPPEWAGDAAVAFSDHKRVVVENGAHVFDGLSGLDTCLDATVIRFFAVGSTRSLDVSCFDAMKPEPFGAAP
jgi:pimeloyl-ACP methyl ester carboxylesterase